MNLPNMLTFLRFLLIPVYLAVFASGSLPYAFLIVLLAGLTDILDGYLARARNEVTLVGTLLDPLADKLMIIAVLVTLLVTGRIPLAAGILLLARDAIMIVGVAIFHFRGKKAVPANWLGKLTTVLFYVAMLLVFFELPFAMAALWIAIACSIMASLHYIALFQGQNREQAIPK